MAGFVGAALWAVGSAWATEAAIFVVANAAVINTVAMLTVNQAAAAHQRRKAQAAARAAYNASLEDRLVTMATTSGARSRVYGRVRNSDGVLFKATRGTNSEFYTLVIALAGHEIDAVETVYFNDVALTLDGNGWVQTEPWAKAKPTTHWASVTVDGNGGGVVHTGQAIVAGSAIAAFTDPSTGYATSYTATISGTDIIISGGPGANTVDVMWQQSTTQSKARVRAFLGAPGQNLATAGLATDFPSLITNSHRFAGIACLRVDLEFDTDAFTSGVPNITATMRGAKCYNPVTTVTEWTENPSIIARDWALYANGGGCLDTHLHANSFNDALNACNVMQNFVSNSGTVNQKTYTCGIVCRTDADPWAQMQEIVESMAGKVAWSGGKLRVVAGAYRTPVAAITEDWLGGQGSIQIVPEPPTDEAVNVYRPTIADAAQKYVAVPAPEVRAAAYITADGRELPIEVTLGGVTDVLRAQHVCGVLMRDAREALTVTLPCSMRAYQIELFDVVTVTLARFGWSGKEFEVVSRSFSLDGGVLLTLKETGAAIFTMSTDFLTLDALPNTQLPDAYYAPAVAGVTVTTGTQALADGSVITRARVAWTPITDARIAATGRIEVQYTLVGAGAAVDWATVTEAGGAVESIITGLLALRGYVFRVRCVNALGVRGAWSTQMLAIMPSVSVAWGTVTGRPLQFRVISRGSFDTQAPAGVGIYNAETSTLLANSSRSYNFARIRRSDGVVVLTSQHDVFGQGVTQANALAALMDATDSAHIAVVWGYDEPQGQRLVGNLPAAMYRCGASRAVFGSPQFKFRSAYVLVGIGGCGEGGGFEAYQGAVDSDTNAWCDVAFNLQNEQLIVTGTSATPRTLADYSYTGSLGATTTFVSATQPTPTAVGDLWIDTANGNKVLVWNGANWTAYRFDTSAIQPLAASYVVSQVDAAPGYGNSNICQRHFAPIPKACTLLVTATGTLQCNNTTGSTKYRRSKFAITCFGDIGGAGTDYDSKLVSGNIANGELAETTVTSQYVFENVAAGTDVYIGITCSGHTSRTIADVPLNFTLKVEQLYL